MNTARSARTTAARRRGFYGRKFKLSEWHDLEKASFGLLDEIAMLRIAIRRLFEAASQEELRHADSWLRILAALSQATARLAVLLKTQKALAGDEGDELRRALVQALKEMNDELREAYEA